MLQPTYPTLKEFIEAETAKEVITKDEKLFLEIVSESTLIQVDNIGIRVNGRYLPNSSMSYNCGIVKVTDPNKFPPARAGPQIFREGLLNEEGWAGPRKFEHYCLNCDKPIKIGYE